jgi:hypothetical protein
VIGNVHVSNCDVSSQSNIRASQAITPHTNHPSGVAFMQRDTSGGCSFLGLLCLLEDGSNVVMYHAQPLKLLLVRALHQKGVGYARVPTPALTCRCGCCTGAHVRVQWLSAFQCMHGMVQYVRCRRMHWQLTKGVALQVLFPVAPPPHAHRRLQQHAT